MNHGRLAQAAALLVVVACRHETDRPTSECDASISVPDGFCAIPVADTVGRARHLAVRSNGDLFVARLSSRNDSGGITAIRGTRRLRFGSGAMHGLVLASDSSLYASTAHEILHFTFKGDSLGPRRNVDTIVTGLPSGYSPSHSLALDGRGGIFVSIEAINAGCGKKMPCPDLMTTAGIWRFDTGKKRQTLADAHAMATGLRNPMALAVNPRDTLLYAVSHGPDSLHERFPAFDAFVAASRPGDEFIRVASTRPDFGWPYCYFDVIGGVRVQSPEYGGDGKVVGNCDRLIRPLIAFPAHWNAIALVFPSGGDLPSDYRDGAFVAFHGSTDPGPLPEGGYSVVYVPFKNGIPTMDFKVFATGFAGGADAAAGPAHRPAGLALGPDGSLYVSDDRSGRIWKITHHTK